MTSWKPIKDCPNNTSVIFCWPGGCMHIGRMQHDQERMGGFKQDSFWGGAWANTADDDPPQWWIELPEPPQPPPQERYKETK